MAIVFQLRDWVVGLVVAQVFVVLKHILFELTVFVFELHDLLHNQVEIWIYWIFWFKSVCLFNQSFDKHFSCIDRPFAPNLCWNSISVVHLVIDFDNARLLNNIANLSPSLRDAITLLESDFLVVIVLALSTWRWLLFVILACLVRPQFIFFVLSFLCAAISPKVFIHWSGHFCHRSLLQLIILHCAKALKSQNIPRMAGSRRSFALKCVEVTWKWRSNCLTVRWS